MPAPHAIVRPLDTPRLDTAKRGVTAQMREIHDHGGTSWDPQLVAGLYAAAALQADDAHAAALGLITQHYGVTRADLAAVLDLARQALDGQHAAPGKLHQDCRGCDTAFALGRVRNAVEWTSTAVPAGRAR